jgi:hypothetical protein
MHDVEWPRIVLLTAGAGTTLSLIEVWDGLGHAFTADGLATPARMTHLVKSL